MFRSQLCTYESLMAPELLAWADRLRPVWEPVAPAGSPTLVHRKMWEWLYVAHALEASGMLQPGKRGLGFGVGLEPLVAAFASFGCEIVATDLDPVRAAAAGWVSTEQHALGLEDLNRHGLCPPSEFEARVTFRVVDMNDIPSDLQGFDFAWSLCALEHLGTLTHGTDFIRESLRCVRPGGIVAHTTEFNLSSDDATVEAGPTVAYRRRDIDELVRSLRREGHRLEVDYTPGSAPADVHVDEPPYSNTHLRIRLDEFVITSMGLVVQKATRGRAAAASLLRAGRRVGGRARRLARRAVRLARRA